MGYILFISRNIDKTRMYSSRNAFLLPYRRVSLTETPLDRDPHWTETPRRESPQTETAMDRGFMLGQRPPCEQNDWQMHVKILPCRNFVAGGKKKQLPEAEVAEAEAGWGWGGWGRGWLRQRLAEAEAGWVRDRDHSWYALWKRHRHYN